jgi:hypothetical protein
MLEVLVALSVLAVGLLTLAATLTMALSRITTSSWDILAKEKASETIENILASRDAGRLTWDQMQNVGAGAGVFKTGAQPIVGSGVDRLINTNDDDAILEKIRRAGPDGIIDTNDDVLLPLSNYTRQITVGPVAGVPGNTLREIKVTIVYTVGGSRRRFEMSSYVSSFTT